MECTRNCAWFQELLFIIATVFMVLGGIFVLMFFGDLVSYHRVLLPVGLVIACGVLGCTTCFVVHYQRFVEAEQSRWLLVLSGVFYICCGIGCYIFLACYANIDIHLGKMDAYTVDLRDKEMIDKTQILFQCCGENWYTDWFNVDWQGTGIEPIGDCNVGNIVSQTAVPFSCCSPDAAAPCIHNYLHMDMDSRLNRGGCKPALVAAASIFSLIFGILLLIMGMLMLVWAFFSSDEVYDECGCDYEDKISILMSPSQYEESQVSANEVFEEISYTSFSESSVEGKLPYQSPEVRHAQVLREHEHVLMDISPSPYNQARMTYSSDNFVESIYSETESEESSESSSSS